MSRISVFTLLSRSEKNMGSGMHPQVKEHALELIKRAYHEGINAQITEGFRSYARQNQLYAQGRTTPGNIVTNARGGSSIHNFGLAIDYVLVSQDGSKAIWSVTPQWRRVATIGKSQGFQWGGDWTSFRDYPHLDMQRGVSLARLRAGVRPTIPPIPYRAYKGPGDTGIEITAIQRNLNKVGIPTGTDGAYGNETVAAVAKFQLRYGLFADGLYGKASDAAMSKALKGEKPVQASKPTDVAEITLPEGKSKDMTIPKHLEADVKGAIAMGVTNGIRPNDHTTRAETAAMIFRATDGRKYSDKIREDFEDDIAYAIQEGLTNGIRPNEPMMRGEGMVIMARAYRKLQEQIKQYHKNDVVGVEASCEETPDGLDEEENKE